MTEHCEVCGRDTTAPAVFHLEHDGDHHTRWQLCSGCVGAIELTLLQRRLDTYVAPALGSRR